MIESSSPPFADRESQNRNSPLWTDCHGEKTRWLEVSLELLRLLPQWRPSTYPKGPPCVVPVLKELIWDAVTEVLSALQNLSIVGFKRSGPVNVCSIGEFIATRELSGHPVGVRQEKRGSDQLIRELMTT